MPGHGQRPEKLLLRGRLSTFRRRCGKPGCRCADRRVPETPTSRSAITLFYMALGVSWPWARVRDCGRAEIEGRRAEIVEGGLTARPAA